MRNTELYRQQKQERKERRKLLGEADESKNTLWRRVTKKATTLIRPTEFATPSSMQASSITKSILLGSRTFQRDEANSSNDFSRGLDLFESDSPLRKPCIRLESSKTLQHITEEKLSFAKKPNI